MKKFFFRKKCSGFRNLGPNGTFGDCNSRYFHCITTIKRCKNKVDCLQDDSGNWVSDSVELETMVTGFYKELFTDH